MLELPDITMLPPTGQTVSYRSGDDGDIRPGWRHPRFTVVGNLVVDAHAGLMWVRQTPLIVPGGTATATVAARGMWLATNNYAVGDLVQGDGSPNNLFYIATAPSGPANGGAHEPPATTWWTQTPWTASAANLTSWSATAWNTAIDNANALVYAGFADWRLPNILELVSLQNFGSASGVYTEFPNVPTAFPNYFWSATTCPSDTTLALCHQPSYNFDTAAKATSMYVRLVRSL